jgi:hypothetical protein
MVLLVLLVLLVQLVGAFPLRPALPEILGSAPVPFNLGISKAI